MVTCNNGHPSVIQNENVNIRERTSDRETEIEIEPREENGHKRKFISSKMVYVN